MEVKGKKFISLLLVFSLLALSGNLIAKERRGAELIITKKDGQEIRGELIAVKKDSLLLLVSGADVLVDIGDISVITIVKKSKFLLGLGAGLSVGVMIVMGMSESLSSDWGVSEENIYLALGIVASSALIGGVAGGFIGRDERIQIKGKSPEETESILLKLRSKARIPDYQ